MPFVTSGPEPLDAVANVRLTSSEKTRLKDNAEIAALSLSALMRRWCLGKQVIAKSDAVMIRELRRLGGLVKNIHNESDRAYSHQTAELLVLVKSYIERLSGDSEKD